MGGGTGGSKRALFGSPYGGAKDDNGLSPDPPGGRGRSDSGALW